MKKLSCREAKEFIQGRRALHWQVLEAKFGFIAYFIHYSHLPLRWTHYLRIPKLSSLWAYCSKNHQGPQTDSPLISCAILHIYITDWQFLINKMVTNTSSYENLTHMSKGAWNLSKTYNKNTNVRPMPHPQNLSSLVTNINTQQSKVKKTAITWVKYDSKL